MQTVMHVITALLAMGAAMATTKTMLRLLISPRQSLPYLLQVNRNRSGNLNRLNTPMKTTGKSIAMVLYKFLHQRLF